MTFWFDPMVNTVGMPNNPGPAGNNLAATQAMNNQLTAQRNYVGAQDQAMLNQNFAHAGGQNTAYYAALAAAYGRATGGFGGAPGRVGTIGNPGGGAAAAQTPTPMPTPRPFGLGASAVPYASSANYFSAYANPRIGASALPSTGYPTSLPPTTGFGGAGGYVGYDRANPFTSYQSSGIDPFAGSTFSRAVQGNVGAGAGSYTLPRVYINSPAPTTPLSNRFSSAFSQLGAQARTNPLANMNAYGAVANPIGFNTRLTPYQMPAGPPPPTGAGWDIGGRARGTPAAPVPMPQPRPAMGDMFANRFSAAFPASGRAAPVGAASFASRYAPFANTAGTSPLARGLTSPTASFNDRFSALGMGVGQPTWSPGGITMADRLRQMQPSQPAPAPDFASRYGAFQPPNWGAGTLSRADLAIPHAYPAGVRR